MIPNEQRRNALTEKANHLAAAIDQAMPYLESRLISRQVAEMFRLGYDIDGEYAGRVSIPYLTPGGVVTIKYRCADLEHGEHKGEVSCPKYLYETGLGVHLFNAHVLLTTADRVIITEGEFDAMCIQAYLGVPAVAYPGTKTWQESPHFPLCFEGVSEVVILADGDKPGKDAAQKVSRSLSVINVTNRVVNLPNDTDANQIIATHGAKALIERIG